MHFLKTWPSHTFLLHFYVTTFPKFEKNLVFSLKTYKIFSTTYNPQSRTKNSLRNICQILNLNQEKKLEKKLSEECLRSTEIRHFLVKISPILRNFCPKVKFRAFWRKFRARNFLKVHLQSELNFGHFTKFRTIWQHWPCLKFSFREDWAKFSTKLSICGHVITREGPQF